MYPLGLFIETWEQSSSVWAGCGGNLQAREKRRKGEKKKSLTHHPELMVLCNVFVFYMVLHAEKSSGVVSGVSKRPIIFSLFLLSEVTCIRECVLSVQFFLGQNQCNT